MRVLFWYPSPCFWKSRNLLQVVRLTVHLFLSGFQLILHPYHLQINPALLALQHSPCETTHKSVHSGITMDTHASDLAYVILPDFWAPVSPCNIQCGLLYWENSTELSSILIKRVTLQNYLTFLIHSLWIGIIMLSSKGFCEGQQRWYIILSQCWHGSLCFLPRFSRIKTWPVNDSWWKEVEASESEKSIH